MAAMAGHEHDLVLARDGAQRVHMVEVDAVVEPGPEPAQEGFHEVDEGVGIVGGDLLAVAARREQRLATRDLLGPDLLRGGGAHRAGVEHAREDGAAVREVGTDARSALAAEGGAPGAGDARGLRLDRPAVVEHAAQAHRLAQFDHGEAAVEQHLQHLAQAAAEHPALGEPQPQP